MWVTKGILQNQCLSILEPWNLMWERDLTSGPMDVFWKNMWSHLWLCENNTIFHVHGWFRMWENKYAVIWCQLRLLQINIHNFMTYSETNHIFSHDIKGSFYNCNRWVWLLVPENFQCEAIDSMAENKSRHTRLIYKTWAWWWNVTVCEAI